MSFLRSNMATEKSPPSVESVGPESINDTWFNRFVTLAAIKLLGRLRPRNGMIMFVTENTCIKYGPLRHLPEASTMNFIAHNTSLPVSKIRCAFERKGWTYIVIERVKGQSITHGWESRTADSKAEILRQLKEMVQSIRSLTPSSLAVANVDGGPLWDCRLPGKTLHLGPFENIDAFHQHLRGGLDAPSDKLPAQVNELVQLHSREWPAPVFTHGDLSSLNIMAQSDTVTGIIDWETAGWYQYYWEYTTACQVNFRNTFWRDEIDNFLEPLPEELAMEKIRQTYFSDI